MVCDDGSVIDMRYDSPAVVKDVVIRAVRRWRVRRLAEQFPHLVPDAPDFAPRCSGSRQEQQLRNHIFDFTGVLSGIMKARSSGGKAFDLWRPECKLYVISAISGGQWPQARLAATKRGWVQDDLCRLCFESPGTLQHRHMCLATRPLEGWQAPPHCCQGFPSRISPARHDLLRTRGLLVAKVSLPPKPIGDTFIWLVPPPQLYPDDCIWFIDGSLFDGAQIASGRTGFGVVVVASSGELLAYGHGVPPDWINDAAGAEAWAYFAVIRENVEPPQVVTDCKGVLDTLTAGATAATSHDKRLARVWTMTAQQLDGDFSVAATRTVWMPAHGAAHTIGVARDSRGQPITALMWRANRLVDLLAKRAAAPDRVCASVMRGLDECKQYVRYCLAKLGVVTFAANHCRKVVLADDGSSTTVLARDSEAARPPRKPCPRQRGGASAYGRLAISPPPPPGTGGGLPLERIVAPASQSEWSNTMRVHSANARRPAAEMQAAKRRRHQRWLKRHREAAEDETRTAKWLRTRQPTCLPSTASARLEALQKRVRERVAAQPAEEQQQQQQQPLSKRHRGDA